MLDTRPSSVTTRSLILTLMCLRCSLNWRSALTRLLKSLVRRRSLTLAQSCGPGVRGLEVQDANRPTTNNSASESPSTVLSALDRFSIPVLLSLEIGNHRQQTAPRLLAEVNRPPVRRPRQAGKVEIRVAVSG